MVLIVEDGTGLATADSYFTIEQFRLYADSYGLARLKPDVDAAWLTDLTDTAIEISARTGTSYIDILAKERWTGQRKRLEQALAWPRIHAYVGYGTGDSGLPIMYSAGPYRHYASRRSYSYAGIQAAIGGVAWGPNTGRSTMLPSDTVPDRVVRAAILATARDLVTPNSLMPDITGGRDVVSETVGPISVTYASDRLSAPIKALLPRFVEIEEVIRPLIEGQGSSAQLMRG